MNFFIILVELFAFLVYAVGFSMAIFSIIILMYFPEKKFFLPMVLKIFSLGVIMGVSGWEGLSFLLHSF